MTSIKNMKPDNSNEMMCTRSRRLLQLSLVLQTKLEMMTGSRELEGTSLESIYSTEQSPPDREILRLVVYL